MKKQTILALSLLTSSMAWADVKLSCEFNTWSAEKAKNADLFTADFLTNQEVGQDKRASVLLKLNEKTGAVTQVGWYGENFSDHLRTVDRQDKRFDTELDLSGFTFRLHTSIEPTRYYGGGSGGSSEAKVSAHIAIIYQGKLAAKNYVVEGDSPVLTLSAEGVGSDGFSPDRKVADMRCSFVK